MRARHRASQTVLSPIAIALCAGMIATGALTVPFAADAQSQGPTDLTTQVHVRPAAPKVVGAKTATPKTATPNTATPKTATPKTSAAKVPAPKPALRPASATATGAAAAQFEVELPESLPVATWTLDDAQALRVAIRGVGADGLFARDYQPAALAAQVARALDRKCRAGPGDPAAPRPGARAVCPRASGEGWSRRGCGHAVRIALAFEA